MSKDKIEELAWDLIECHTEFSCGQNGEIHTNYGATAQKLFDRGWCKPCGELLDKIEALKKANLSKMVNNEDKSMELYFCGAAEMLGVIEDYLGEIINNGADE